MNPNQIKDQLFGQFKNALGDFKMPQDPQSTINDVNEIATGEGNWFEKLGKIKDKFFSKDEDNQSEE